MPIWNCGNTTSSPRSNLMVNFWRLSAKHSSWLDGFKQRVLQVEKSMQNHWRHESGPFMS
jgi:hypothetical protein